MRTRSRGDAIFARVPDCLYVPVAALTTTTPMEAPNRNVHDSGHYGWHL